MKFLKRFESVDAAIDTTQETPFIGFVDGFDRRAVFASTAKHGDSCTLVSDGAGYIMVYNENARSFSRAFSKAFGNKLN